MKIAVTGANGLIGANLVRELLQHHHQVRAVVRATSELSAIENLPLQLHYADVARDFEALVEAFRGCTLVFHTAMHFSYDSQRAAALEAAAIDGTTNVLRAAAATKVKRVVLTSSSVVFGYDTHERVRDEQAEVVVNGEDNAYVLAKIRQDRLTLELGEALDLDVVLTCPTMTVGPHASYLGPSNGHILAYLSDPLHLTYPGGCNIVASADIARGHRLAAERGQPGQHYILGGENLHWRELHTLVAELAGLDSPHHELNHTLSFLAASYEELRARIERRPALSNRVQAAMIGRFYWYSHARAASLGYRPRPARQAVAEALSWLVQSRHCSRELRARLRMHDDVYKSRYPTQLAAR